MNLYSDYRYLIETLDEYDKNNFEKVLKEYIKESSSYMVSGKENFYQGFMLGLFIILKPYFNAKIEREARLGRCDLYSKALNENDMSYVMEMKVTEDERKMREVAEKTLRQIKEKEYYAEMEPENVENLTLVGIVFYGKKTEFIYETL